MITPSAALNCVPPALRNELLDEYNSIVRNFLERRWGPSELSGGKFCEIVYSILDGYIKGTYPATAFKPANFVGSCRQLEQNTAVPRSFQILIPRILPALYEIRNNRGVGHVGVDVNPNHMDAMAVLSLASWVLAELIRVFHNVSPAEAQNLVDAITERKIPLVWQSGAMKRVLDPKISFRDQLLILIASSPGGTAESDLLTWTEQKNHAYFRKTLRNLHKERLIDVSNNGNLIQLLPPGSKYVAENLLK